MVHSLRTAISTAALAFGVLLAGCSPKPSTPPVTIGSLPADVGPEIPLNGELDRYGSFQDWPSACELVTDQTLRSLLPQIGNITRKPESRSYEITAPDLTKVPGEINVPEARCATRFSIPVGMLANNAGTVHTDIMLAGSPDFVQRNKRRGTGVMKGDIKGGTCEPVDTDIQCVDDSGRIQFRLNFQLPHHGPNLKDPSRYDRNGEIVSFTTGNQDTQPRNDYIDANLTKPIVESILSRFGDS